MDDHTEETTESATPNPVGMTRYRASAAAAGGRIGGAGSRQTFTPSRRGMGAGQEISPAVATKPLNARERLLRNAKQSLSNQCETSGRFAANQVRSLASGSELLWRALAKW